MKRIGIYIIALLTVGCTRDRSPEAVTLSGVPVVIASAVTEKGSKAVVENATELAGVQFLRKDGAEQPTDFSDAVALTGDRGANGTITFTPSVPMYQLSSNKAYFRAYHPAGTVANGVVRWGVSGDKDILVGSVFDAGSYTAPLTGAGGDKGSPMIFTHRLAQLEVACVADPSDATPEALVQFVWGQVKSIELVETMTELAFDYATGAVEGQQAGAVALLKEDYATAFQAKDLTKVGFKAAAMLVPAVSGTAPIKLRITTDKATEEIEVQLKNNTTPMGFEVGRKHTVSLQFKAADKQILVAGTKVSDWGAGYSSSVTVEGEEWTIGSLAASVANPIAASGAVVSVTSPGAKLGLAWTAGLSVTDGFSLGSVTGTGPTAAAAVTVALNPTNAVRSTVLTATGPYYLSSTLTLSQAASTMGTLSQTPVNDISASGAEVTVTTPGATAGLPWGAGLSNTTGFTLGAVTGIGATGSVPVTVGVNPTNATRSSILTATATGGNTAGTITLTQAGSTLSSASASATTPVVYTATSVDFTVTGTAGLTLAFAKTSGDGAFSTPAALTCDGTAQTVTVTMAANTGGAREAVYSATVTNPGASGLNLTGITVKQAPLYVEINGLRWATGNLVASSSTAGAAGLGGCKIGAPGDGGLYFQFGSLIGYKGGNQANGGTGVGMPQAPLTTDGTFWNGASWGSFAADAQVWPSEMSTTPSAWPSNRGSTTVVDQWFFNYNAAPYSNASQDIRGFSGSFSGDTGTGNLGTGRYAKWGVGDPCTYYLGAPWRLPTTEEIVKLCNNQGGRYGVSWANVGASWVTSPVNGGNFSSNRLFFPASGFRAGGSFNSVAESGYYWSSSVTNAKDGCNLFFNQGMGVFPQADDPRGFGFPVRCVSSVP